MKSKGEKERSERRVIWSVDPFAEDKETQRLASKAIQALAPGMNARVTPVYVWSSPVLDLLEMGRHRTARVRALAASELRKIVGRRNPLGMRPLKIVGHPFLPLNESVSRLIDFAKGARAELIVVSARAGRAPGRWWMGGFAETLLLKSQVPVLVVSPRWKPAERFKTILFATDFSQQSRDAFPGVVQLAKALGCELTIFHKVAPLSVIAPEIYHEPRAKLGVRLERRFLLAQQWAERARNQGVTASVSLDYRSRRSTERAIIDKVAGKPALIAMASHSGPVARILIGSTTRKVVRSAPCPVWVIHPSARRKTEMEKLDFLHLSEQDILDDLQFHGRRGKAA